MLKCLCLVCTPLIASEARSLHSPSPNAGKATYGADQKDLSVVRETVFQHTFISDSAETSPLGVHQQGGRFTATGWQVVDPKAHLRIDLGEVGALVSGELEVTVTGIDPMALSRILGGDKKVHFLNAFSNASGDHHAEQGGRESDALWTLRAGTDGDGGGRYGADLKLLWASRGAKRTQDSDYQEKRLRMPEGWTWNARQAHRFRVLWSREEKALQVWCDDVDLGRHPWLRAGDPLRYLFLGGAADFHALVGATFSDLRVTRLARATRLRSVECREQLVLEDSLTSPVPGQGVRAKTGRGDYGPEGWRAARDGDFLMIELDDAQGTAGALEVTLSSLDWRAANTATGAQKIHFLSMFSHPRADHHVEDGGTNVDALWSLRGGKAADGGPAYGGRFNILWASRGAKRSEPSDYEETTAPMAPGWTWDRDRYRFRIEWDKHKGKITGRIDGQVVFHEPWLNQVSPLRYVYLAKSPDFGTFVGPRYSDLKVYRFVRAEEEGNRPPSVVVRFPANGAVLKEAVPVELGVDVSDDGTVARVDYFLDDRKVGEAMTPPFGLRLSEGLPAKWYKLTAKAYDSLGAQAESPPKYFTVGQPWAAWGSDAEMQRRSRETPAGKNKKAKAAKEP